MEVYFGWLGLDGYFLWVDGGGWRYSFWTFYRWVGVGGGIFWVDGGGRTFLWIGGGGWRYILCGWDHSF